MNHPPVVLGGCTSYDRTEVRRALRDLLEPLGGMSAFVEPGERILIKANLLAGRKAEAAVTTHPAVVVETALMVREAGAVPLVGDSPGLESTASAAGRCGLAEALAEEGVDLLDFGPEVVTVTGPETNSFRRFQVASVVGGVDGVINLPKLKTHGQMSLTIGVKNTLGCVVGLEKAQWHLRASDPSSFAKALLGLHDAVSPRLTILDAVVGMQGNGPLSGTPVHTGLLAASRSARALDHVVAGLVSFSVEEVPTISVAALKPSDLVIERLSSMPSTVPAYEPAWRKFHVGWLPYAPLRNLLRSACAPRPDFDENRCVACYRCVEICPAKALSVPGGAVAKAPVLDLEACIRCFCCQEICPVGAVRVSSSWLGRAVAFFRGRGKG